MSLVCYLDDSGTDKANPFVTMAGYVGTVDAWRAFENEARPLLNEFGVSVVHAKEFYSNDNEYEGWSIDKRCDFIRRINAVLAPRVGLAVSFSTLKGNFVESPDPNRPRKQSPYGFCFQGLFEMLLRDDGFARTVKLPGVSISFVIEDGNPHNNEIQLNYERIKTEHKTALPFLGEMTIEKKASSIAIQMADLFAFFTRRQTIASERNSRVPVKNDRYLKILRQGIRDLGHAATGFGYN